MLLESLNNIVHQVCLCVLCKNKSMMSNTAVFLTSQLSTGGD